MKLILSESVFNTSNSNYLHAIANLAVTGRHRLEIEDENSDTFKSWINGLKAEDREEWEIILDEAYVLETREPARRSVRIVNAEETDWKRHPPHLSISEAVLYLTRPFRVLVENSTSDRSFLLRMADTIQRDVLVSLEGRYFVEFENGGGISYMPAIIQRIANTEPWMLQQYLVIFDSDALQPGNPSSQSQHLRTVCENAGVIFHQLERRNIENYLTKEALRGWAYSQRSKRERDRKRIFDAFISMNEPQRFHFKLKEGLSATHWLPMYESLADKDRQALQRGFGSGISGLFEGEAVTEAHLRRESAWAEMNPIVVQLLALLR